MSFTTIEFLDEEEILQMIDQRKLPAAKEYYRAEDYHDVKFAISDMVIRGAPAIGAAGAYGVYLAAREFSDLNKEEFLKRMEEASGDLKQARPTAVNLFWAIDRMGEVIEKNRDSSAAGIVEKLKQEADKICEEDVRTNKRMARHGNKVVPEGAGIIHHCNTGALATVDYGTALGVIREAYSSGKNIHVYVDETRPRLQGARLTGFELVEEKIPATLIADSAAPALMKKGEVDLVLVGADRVASNGDVANKIGTFMLALAADRYDVPFYVVAPTSTIDFEVESGHKIDIEERGEDEIKVIGGAQIAPEEIDAYNPAFDITPASMITGIVTEEGILSQPLADSIEDLKSPDK